MMGIWLVTQVFGKELNIIYRVRSRIKARVHPTYDIVVPTEISPLTCALAQYVYMYIHDHVKVMQKSSFKYRLKLELILN